MSASKKYFERIGARLLSRRDFVQGVAAAGLLSRLGLVSHSSVALGVAIPEEPAVLTGDRYDLVIESLLVDFTGRRTSATAINGSVPGPILKWREGDTVTLAVTNRLPVPTSIHWHGIRAPADMDGVPGLSFPGIAPNETFVYRIPVRQSGTYWYHSHSRFQEQTGLSGPLIIEPRDKDPIEFDRDYVVMLTDWTDENPDTVYGNLKSKATTTTTTSVLQAPFSRM